MKGWEFYGRKVRSGNALMMIREQKSDGKACATFLTGFTLSTLSNRQKPLVGHFLGGQELSTNIVGSYRR